MQLGAFELATISGGRMWLDGGTMFGVVPKTLWSRMVECDEKNLIPQATNCLLVQTPDRLVLIDTGYGSKLTEKQQRILKTDVGDPLSASLDAVGVSVDRIDLVILTHLHFDHAGGSTRRDDAGELVPAFPNAEYVVQRGEWDVAAANLPELHGAYSADDFLPLRDSGRLRLVEPDEEIVPGFRARVTPGHTEWHQSIVIESDGQTAVYLGDLCPSTHHLPMAWCMSYDIHMLETRRQKRRLLGEIADNGWLAFFDHDPACPVARIERDETREFRIKKLPE
ncbi:MAG: MBL fold metallo-hydrolase [Planctomycetota bacterium]|nr:MBL fold metallo-hydrolase [Planctomycetota bacterium]